MMTVHEVSALTGVSVRALQYYDRMGLLSPAAYTEAGYRLYDEGSLERLQQIMLFKELEFPLKDIKAILDSPDFNRTRALEQQITLLTMKKEHLENLILLAQGVKLIGVNAMNFKAFDRKKLDEYAERAKKEWGNTDAYREYSEKAKNYTEQDERRLANGITEIFVRFGELKDDDPSSDKAQSLVGELKDFITENCYTCTEKILSGLGKMYSGGGEITENIDSVGGDGTALFAAKAIEHYTHKEP